jgi:hypothetical protein
MNTTKRLASALALMAATVLAVPAVAGAAQLHPRCASPRGCHHTPAQPAPGPYVVRVGHLYPIPSTAR